VRTAIVLQFQPAQVIWWQKPLVRVDGRILPAELAVLAIELDPLERGVWMNSRGTRSGVVDLVPVTAGGGSAYATRRAPLPSFVARALASIYRRARLVKGCPDLVIWHLERNTFRLVEVKRAHWDAVTTEQERFMRAAARDEVRTSVVEWEFATGAA
jgi:hypothetical protein